MHESSPTSVSPLPIDEHTILIATSSKPNNPENHNTAIDCIDKMAWQMALNPVIAATGPLLHEAYRLRHTTHAQPRHIRHQLQLKIQALEQELNLIPCSNEQTVAIRYAVCCLLDEMVMQTKWGETWWAQRSLLIHFYHEAWGGEKFFLLLEKLQQRPQEHHTLLTLLHFILCLGFEGRYRVETDGAHQLLLIRQQLAKFLQTDEHDPLKAQLSLTWQGTDAHPLPRQRNNKRWWLWSAVVLWTGLMYSVAALDLKQTSETIAKKIRATAELEKTPTSSATVTTLPWGTLFKAEIARGDLTIYTLPGRDIVVAQGDAIFNAGSADIRPTFIAILQRLGVALAKTQHHILVEGHTDNQTIQGPDYASNQALSQARADAAAQVIGHILQQPERIQAQGLADRRPQNSNQTPSGRALNRRVEITIIAAKIHE